jgi:hypothetical protein
MAASSIDASSGDSSGKFNGLPGFPDTMGAHTVHLHYPSGNPHDDQAVYVDSIAATGRKTEAIHDELYNASGTRRVKDVVVVTPHTTRVLITIIRIRELLEGAEGPTKKQRV